MRRRVPGQALRGLSITSLEIQTQDLLRKPLGQLAPENICDLFALSDLEDIPKGFSSTLQDFTFRISKEIGDIPIGPSWVEYLDELALVPAERIPVSFRKLLIQQFENESRRTEVGSNILESWAPVDPLLFDLGEQAPPIETPRAPVQRSKATKRTSAPTKAGKTQKPVDVARNRLLRLLILERVNARLQNGLKEAVLVAGIRHRTKQEYPDLLPNEIISLLKEMKETGQLHYSAGRWKRASAW